MSAFWQDVAPWIVLAWTVVLGFMIGVLLLGFAVEYWADRKKPPAYVVRLDDRRRVRR